MNNENLTRMQRYKVQKYINWYGLDLDFHRAKLDDLKQPVLDEKGNPVTEVIQTIRGVFHKTGETFVLIAGDAGRIQNKPVPSVLAMLDEKTEDIEVDDWVIVEENMYKVVSVNNVGSLGLFADVSLELVLNGLPV